MKIYGRILSVLFWIAVLIPPAGGADFEFRGAVNSQDPIARLLAYYIDQFTPEELSLIMDERPDDTGRFRDLYMDLKGVKIGGVRVERLTFRMVDVQFNSPLEWAAGNVECLDALRIYARCLLKEDDVNKKLASQTFGKDEHWKDISMTITPEAGFQARGTYAAKILFFTLDILIEAEGGLRIVNGRELWLDDYKFRVNTLDVPDYVARRAIDRIQPLLNLGRFPLPLSLHSVEFQEHQAVLSTRVLPEPLQGGITCHYLSE
jgi:hypothetical protein